MSSVSSPFSDHLLHDFNSDSFPDVQTPEGPLNLDWFSDLEASNFWDIAYPTDIAFLRYGVYKSIWDGIRLAHLPGAPPITRGLPYADPGERNAAIAASIPMFGYRDIFTPEYLEKECPKCGQK